MNVLFFGLGRIGLPQSLVFANSGHQVFGYDSDPAVVDALAAGICPFIEPGMEELLDRHLSGRFRAIHDWKAVLGDIDAVLFTLGTKAPDSVSCLQEEEGDLSAIESILRDLLTHPGVKKKILLVFRTTLFLGSTERLKNFVEKELALEEGRDFLMSFVPERLVEGQAIAEERSLPKILSGFSEEGRAAVAALFEPVGGRQIFVSSPTTAEFCKLTDNSYRNTMFAFANELAMWAGSRGVDALEAINAINSDYERNSVPKPGFVSGYCLGKDPYIFEYGFRRPFQSLWYYGRRTNDHAVDYAVSRILNALEQQSVAPAEAKVAVLGLSFKEDIDDFRMSHAFDLIDALTNAGVGSIVGFDPQLEVNKYTRVPEKYRNDRNTWIRTLERSAFDGVNAVIIAHRHEVIRSMSKGDIAALISRPNRQVFVFDGWNVWRSASDVQGVQYEALGFIGKAA